MRVRKKLFRILLLCVLSLAMSVPALAAEGEAYTYTVRIYSGQQGVIDGGEVKVYEGLSYGERVIFNMSEVALVDGSKYYVKGLRESGRDNNTVMENASFMVTGDRDYVVAYGLLNDAVAYTIRYEDAEGNTLAPSETYYGNVGDKPVIAYLYIEGYQPQAYNLTKTLDANAAENVFTFIYSPLAGETGTETNPASEETEGAGGTGEGTAAGTDEPGAGDAENESGEAGDAGDDNAVDIPDALVPQAGPVEQQDLDIEDTEVPLGSYQPDSRVMSLLNGNALLVRIPAAVKVCVLVLIIGIVCLIVRKLTKRKKETEA